MSKKLNKLHKTLASQGVGNRSAAAKSGPSKRAAAKREEPPRGPGWYEAREHGKQVRQRVPRSKLGAWGVQRDRTEALDLLFAQDENRLPYLVPERHQRMAANPFAFYRGAAAVMAADLASAPSTGQVVQACGDAHIANFGGYRSPESHLVFDLNDFDETAPAPWDWDVRRLVASVAVCGRYRGFGEEWCREAAQLTAESYRRAMRYFARQGALDVWRAYIDVAEVLHSLADSVSKADRRQVASDLERAFAKTNERAFDKLVTMKDGRARMTYDPPDIVPLSFFLSPDNAERVLQSLRHLMEGYRSTVTPTYQPLLANYQVLGIAQKVVGVGSVGTRCWVAALAGTEVADPLVLQIKEANASVLERWCGKSRYASHGERVVQGQRLMQATSGVLLGWTSAPDEDGVRRDYYVRQLWNWKMSVNLEKASADELEIYSQLCAWTLARAHARTGDRGAIAGYLGKSGKFDRAMAAFACAYADQNEVDYEAFLKRIGK